jgi:hypothetical protein
MEQILEQEWGTIQVSDGLGYALMSYGLGMDWEEGFDKDKKPPYVRKSQYVPCGCKRCFFCKNGKTHGINHKRVGWSLKKAKECPEEQRTLVKRACIANIVLQQVARRGQDLKEEL